MSGIVLENLKKIYPGGVEAVKDFSLEIRDREFIVLVGPSGCGKSTVLRMIAGLEEITDGELYIDGNLVNHIAPKDRDLAMVFQNYALYPHMTIYKNLAFALSLRKLSSKEIDAKVRETAKMLDIDHLLDRKPKALSGGQRQRVALGRAMVREPKAFLLDEPLSNLDAKLRATTRTEIAKIHKKLGTTFIYVTHDQTEAMTMADRIVVMKDGQIQQIGEPKEIYDSPNNLFVAGFIGTPQMNFLEAMIEKDVDYYALIDDKRFVLSNERFGDILNEYRGKNVVLGIRSEDIFIAQGSNSLKTTVEVCENMGSEVYMYMDHKGQKITARLNAESACSEGSLNISFNKDKIHIFDKDSGISIRNLGLAFK